MKKNETKKEITLDDLASMVQNGFTELRSEFKSGLKLMNEKIDSMDKRIDSLDEKIELLDEKVEKISLDVSDIKANINKKVDKFEHKSL